MDHWLDIIRPNLPAIISGVKDVVVGGAAIVTATVAVRGLQKWRDELRGKANFEVARGLARATYKLRDEIQSCRSPLIRGAEYPADYHLENPHDRPNPRAEAEALAHVYNNRWKRVSEAIQEFDAQALEAEALWGADIRETTQNLRRCAHTVFVSFEAIIDDKAAGGAHFEQDRAFGRRMRANAHAAPDANDNELSNDIAAAVRMLEEKLRGYLTRAR